MKDDDVVTGLMASLPSGELRETHMSWVLLTPDRAFKRKKPVRFDFLDLRKPAARRPACEEEVRVNEALAADVVLGVRAVVPDGEGFRLDGADAPGALDWVVEMRRFDEDRTMASVVLRGSLRREDVAATAQRIATFHAQAAGDLSPEVQEAFARLVVPLYAGPGHEDVPPRLMALSAMNADIAAHFFRRLAAGYDVRPRLPEIAVPALVVTGRHDWVSTPAAGRALAGAIPGARLVELPDAGHFGFSETPAPFLRAVREHLARVAETLSCAGRPGSSPCPATSAGPAASTSG